MRRPQIGLVGLVVTVAAAVVVLSGIVVLEALYHAIAAAEIPPAAAARVRNGVLSSLLALALVIMLLAVVAGRSLRDALGALRSAVLARARGQTDVPMPQFTLRELTGVANAVDRVSVRDAAREAEAKRESTETGLLLDAISEGILRIDQDGRILRANPAARAVLGLSEDVLGEPVWLQIRQADLRALLERAAAGEPVISAEVTLGGRRLMVSARPLSSRQVNRGGAVVAFVDLTEVRRLESVRRDFVANVSHELKTPLTSIRGYLETLLGDDELPVDVRREFLGIVNRNARRLHHIVDDLLDLSRLESGGWQPHPQDVNALEIIDDVWSGCSQRAQQRRVRFSAPEHPVAVRADPGALRQVLTNLFDNALRYTPDGGSISVSTQRLPGGTSDSILFEVRDTGSGIPSDALSRIFERFYRVDPARSRAEGGTGLGLSIVKHLVESMGGHVRAESELGRGTTIKFTLPAA